MNKHNFRTLLIASLALLPLLSFGQNVGINTTGATPNSAAILDLNTGNSGNMGILPPQAALTDVTVWAPITGTATVGMLVYSTTAPTGGNGVGYYYWGANSQWNFMTTGAGGSYIADSAWTLFGNAGTTPGTNFLGTTDAAALEFKVDNQKAGGLIMSLPIIHFLDGKQVTALQVCMMLHLATWRYIIIYK